MKRIFCILLSVCFLSVSSNAFSGSYEVPKGTTIQDIVKYAEKGDIHGKYVIGTSVLFDEEVLGEKYKDRDQALKWLDEAITEDPSYGWSIGSDLARKNKPVLAQKYLQKAIRVGHTLALRHMADLYIGSQHSKEGNLLAKTYLEAAVSYGEYYGYVRIGHMYQNGWGVEQDHKKAEEYFKMAIKMGDTSGYSALAIMKEKHLPNPNYKEILNLFLKDAPSGEPSPIMGIQRLYTERQKETGLTRKDVLLWAYVQRFQMVKKLGFPNTILEEQTKYHKGLTRSQIHKIKEKAEALAKSFSKNK